MSIYVALLRGINVSGHHKMKMADLKTSLVNIGLQQVKTYLQSGNAVFTSALEDISEIERQISKAVYKDFGYSVKTKVIKKGTFLKIIENNPFLQNPKIDTKQLYYIHLMGAPNKDTYADLENDDKFPEKMVLIGDALFVHYLQGYGRSKLHGGIIEKKLEVAATARNHNTMKNLAELLQAID